MSHRRHTRTNTLPHQRIRFVAALIAVCAGGLALSLPETSATAGERGWSCTAYGAGGKRGGQWQTVSGATSSNKAAASQAALAECSRRGLHSCRPSGCWPA